ncbi:hypothetical protein Bca4012_021828 [Brassica carinata]|uniref:F-box domain-containing protein n=1 Tax=Brassica carinata TaxID=52824 RepID=A0A8X7TXI2_BRACI|nr:hypothetical protein Bca52824_077699 [Brassica carinata]
MLETMDLVSSLPEEVLCRILSFLTTKEADLTSVLSKRWRNLFVSCPNLDIDDSEFLHPQEEGKQERNGVLQSFMDFVDRALALQGDSPIKRFSLKCRTGIDQVRVNLWIRNVLKRGVSDLELVLDFPRYGSDGNEDEDYELPWEMFESKTLVNLKLRSEFGVDWWRDHGTFLPMLRSLSIKDLILLPDDLGVFVSALPVIEELYLAPMTWYWDETVSSKSLRKLTVHANCFAEFEDPKSISFDTPSLVYLDYSDYVAADYPIVNLTNLVEARLEVLVTEDQIQLIRAAPDSDEYDVVVIQRFRNVTKLMSGLRNVQRLSLTADTLEVLSLSCDSMPVFNNLKFLNIKSHKERGWQAVPVLLRNCPHLETIVFEGLIHYVTEDCGDACGCISREDKGRSLVSCPVKKIEIRGFEITVPEMKTIRHLLESLPCLKEMKIYAEEDNDPTNLEVLREYELIEMAMKYYGQLFKCDASFIRPGSL